MWREAACCGLDGTWEGMGERRVEGRHAAGRTRGGWQ